MIDSIVEGALPYLRIAWESPNKDAGQPSVCGTAIPPMGASAASRIGGC